MMSQVRNAYRKISGSDRLQSGRIRLRAWGPQPPVIIYQMGKVGSRSVYEALAQSDLARPVYHVHWLTDDGIAQTEARYQAASTDYRPQHLVVSKALRQRRRNRPHEQWRIITLVRDPVARSLSEFFELMWIMNPDLVNENGVTDVERALDVLAQRFHHFDPSTDRANTWFDHELKAAFGIDVFARPFPRDIGAAEYENEQAKVLLLRLEDLDQTADKIAQFAGLHQLAISKSNSGTDKQHSSAYREVRRRFRLEPDLCREIYSTRYARHFYTETEREAFLQRWSRPADVPVRSGDRK